MKDIPAVIAVTTKNCTLYSAQFCAEYKLEHPSMQLIQSV